MKKIAIFIFICIFSLSFSQLQKFDKWEEAQAISKKENKNILVVFTGSNWCEPCKRMEEKTFKNPDFINFANEHLVIFEVDLRAPIRGDSENYKNYKIYSEKYNNQQFPVLFLLNKDESINRKIADGTSHPKSLITKIKNSLKIK